MRVIFELDTQFGKATDDMIGAVEILYYEGKTYPFYAYPIEITFDKIDELLTRDVHNKGCDCGCNSKS